MNNKRRELFNLYIDVAIKSAISEACELRDSELIDLLKNRFDELSEGLNEAEAISLAASKIPDYLGHQWK